VGVSAESAARAFALPGEPSLAPLGGGHINASWLVTAGGARFVLQRLNTHVFPRPALVMENVARVTAHVGATLAREGAPDAERRALRLVPTQGGEAWHVDAAGGWWRVYAYVEGTVTRDTPRDAGDAYQAALAFGRFQRLLGSYDGPPLHETIPGFHDTPRRVAALEVSAARDAAGRLTESRAELDTLLARRELAHALRGMPTRVVHNDAKLANVLLDARTGQGVCVIDLDTVMPGLSLYDFGDLARSCVSEAAEDETDLDRVVVRRDYLEALGAGFLDGTGNLLGADERGLLLTAARVITYEQAVRFLTDYLDGDRYYPVAPGRPLHNLERARTQTRLLTALQAV
jgi:hypothetical protein